MTVVEVAETRVFATRSGADWWGLYLKRFEPTGRIKTVRQTLGGGIMHVSCADQEEAQWWVENAVDNGVPRSALKIR